jgi:hypothetical protein
VAIFHMHSHVASECPACDSNYNRIYMESDRRTNKLTPNQFFILYFLLAVYDYGHLSHQSILNTIPRELNYTINFLSLFHLIIYTTKMATLKEFKKEIYRWNLILFFLRIRESKMVSKQVISNGKTDR